MNVNSSPGLPEPGAVTTLRVITGDVVLTVAIPLVDVESAVAVTVYEPDALAPSVIVVEACPLLHLRGSEMHFHRRT